MIKQKSTKRALLMSGLALLMCVSMLIGSTYAWFTDTVTSGGNIIKSGTLDVTMEWADGKTDPANTTWKDASTGPIFKSELWEPGYTEVRHIKIANEGTLALKYQINIIANGEVSELADVIDVYYVDPAVRVVDRTALTADKKLGTLTDVLADISTTASGELLAGDKHTITLALKMQESAGNNYQGLEIGSDFSIQLLATQYTSESDSFNNQYDKDAAYPVFITADNISEVDFTEANKTFSFLGAFDDVAIDEIGENSVFDFEGASIDNLTLADDVTIKGEATVGTLKGEDDEPIAVNIIDANISIENELKVGYTEGKAILNIKNSTVKASTIFVGGHTQNDPNAVAELNIIDSYVSCEESGLGSTISVWGKSGVDAKIINSEIHTYSRGWHQSEDANDNSITFQGSGHINVEISKSNFHLYGARSIINARKYGSAETTVDFTIDESLIWVVTKSNHADETLPVWGATEITDSMLLFTKNVHQSTPAVFKSFVYGNPVIHGNYAVTTQCQWDADIALADGQTVTFAEGANVSIYDDAGNVRFVCSDPAQVVVEDGATLTNIGVN